MIWAKNYVWPIMLLLYLLCELLRSLNLTYRPWDKKDTQEISTKELHFLRTCKLNHSYQIWFNCRTQQLWTRGNTPDGWHWKAVSSNSQVKKGLEGVFLLPREVFCHATDEKEINTSQVQLWISKHSNISFSLIFPTTCHRHSKPYLDIVTTEPETFYFSLNSKETRHLRSGLWVNLLILWFILYLGARTMTFKSFCLMSLFTVY